MNQIVARWQRHNQRKRYDGPDAIDMEGIGTVSLATPEAQSMADPIGTARRSVNRHGVVKLALYGNQDRVEMLHRVTTATLVRLRLTAAAANAKAFDEPPEGEGSEPNLHDVMWWLDSLKRGKHDAAEVNFLYRLHATAARRMPPGS